MRYKHWVSLYTIVLVGLTLFWGEQQELCWSITNPIHWNWMGDLEEKDSNSLGHTAVSNEGMNVVYSGLENPLSIGIMGRDISEFDVFVEGDNATLKASNGKYDLQLAYHHEPIRIVVLDTKTNQSVTKIFRTKRLHPVALLGGTKSRGNVRAGEMKAQRGILALLINYEISASCAVQSFRIEKFSAADGILFEAKNEGGSFSGESSELIKSAQAGDVYLFTQIMVKCPGDKRAYPTNDLIFTIK